MNINAMMMQAKKMQAEMEKAQKELEAKEFKVEKQGITVVVSGKKRLVSVNINEALIDPDDKDIIESLVIIAVNEAMDLVSAEEEKAKPSMPNMPF